ncbi:hypothetical protein H3C61_00125 [Candidatus Gracilibacteria bacterium]|nr:hypothetical protein [Candidatus Gracilibacteria bacterium]
MNKKLLGTLALVAMLSLASCGKTETPTEATPEVTPSTEAPAEVTPSTEAPAEVTPEVTPSTETPEAATGTVAE